MKIFIFCIFFCSTFAHRSKIPHDHDDLDLGGVELPKFEENPTWEELTEIIESNDVMIFGDSLGSRTMKVKKIFNYLYGPDGFRYCEV